MTEQDGDGSQELQATGLATPVVGNTQYAGAYADAFAQAQQTGICPFCADQKTRSEIILHHIGAWWVKKLPPDWSAKTLWPKHGNNQIEIPSEVYLIIPERHITWPNQLTMSDWVDVGRSLEWILMKFRISGGGLGMRFDEPSHAGISGRTMFHLHFHVVVPPAWPERTLNEEKKPVVPVPFWVG